jgi:hypothetical protein
MVTPAPRNTARREMERRVRSCDLCDMMLPILIPFVQELLAGHDGLDERRKPVVIGGEPGLHPL